MPEHIVDTGPPVGWINRRDQWHAWSVSVMEGLTPPLVTCESVIAEAAWHLRESREAVDQLYSLVVAGALRIVELLPDHAPHLRALSAKYSQMDFCDAAVVRLSEMHPRAAALTTDIAHFTAYRRFRNRPIPLLIQSKPPSGKPEKCGAACPDLAAGATALAFGYLALNPSFQPERSDYVLFPDREGEHPVPKPLNMVPHASRSVVYSVAPRNEIRR